MSKQEASVYFLGDRLLVAAISRTSAGIWVGLDPPMVGTLADSDAAIGELVETAMALSDEGRPHPDQDGLKNLMDRLLALGGTRRWSEFGRRASLVSVERGGGRYRVARRVKVEEKGGSRIWFGAAAAERELTEPSAGVLGATIRDLLGMAEIVQMRARAR